MGKAKIDVAGLKIDAITKQDFLASVLARIKANQKTFATTPYSEFLYQAFHKPDLLQIFNKADFALADGIGIFWAKRYLEIPLTAKSYMGKIFQGLWQLKYSLAAVLFNRKWILSALPEKIVGADLIWDLAKLASDNQLTMFLLGGFGDTAELTKQKLISKYPDLQISVSNQNPDDPESLNEIKNTQPHILLVAYGPIKQEAWIAHHFNDLPVKLAIGVGGTFDYVAGKRPAPPEFLRSIGLEWLWRLFTQPHRAKRIWQATFGLSWGLWHYKVFSTLPFRKNAAAIILNSEGKILLCERSPKHYHVDVITNKESLKKRGYWQFPQGGLDGNEDPVQGAKREAAEEIGTENLEFIKISPHTFSYIWNNALRGFWKNRNKQNLGQSQNIVYFRFLGHDSEIKVDRDEFVNFTWVKPSDLLNVIHPERRPLAEIVLKDLA